MLTDQIYAEYLDSLLAGNRMRCRTIALGLLDGGLPVRSMHIDLIQRSLYEVGQLWECNQVSVATEHIATAISEALLNLALPYVLPDALVGRTVIVAGVSPEVHQVGARIVADTFELHGWESLFVGASTPTEELVRLVRELEPDMVALSLTMFFNIGALESSIESLHEAVPALPIVVGGQGLKRGGQELASRHQNVRYMSEIHELEANLKANE